MSPNSQKGVSVSGGCPPDSWSVSGGGYWLENDFTYDCNMKFMREGYTLENLQFQSG